MRAIGMNPGHSARVLGAGEMAAGAISAGCVMRGSDPLGEDRRRRFGSEERWLGRFSGPAGSPRLERMYYDRAFPSSLFRTNFLNCHFGVAGASEACRSHSLVDIAYTVPSHAVNPPVLRRTPLWSPCEMRRREITVEASTGLRMVPNRHSRASVLDPVLAAGHGPKHG